MFHTPTAKLVAGFVVAITTLILIATVALAQIRTLRELQEGVVDRNRLDSLQLLRIQNSLNSLAMVSRDMTEETIAGPIPAYRAQIDRLFLDLTDSVRREQALAPDTRTPEDSRELIARTERLREHFLSVLRLAEVGQLSEALATVRGPLFDERTHLSAMLDRLLIQNYEEAERIAEKASEVHLSTERTILAFVFTLILIVIGYGTNSVVYNRRVLRQLEELSQEKGDLARQMIGMQESILRTVSRDLHDDFGQILTAVNAILARILRRAGSQLEPSLATQISEVHDATRQALERARDLSQTLHPALLESHGLDGALDRYLVGFERQTGIRVHVSGKEHLARVGPDAAIHVYRIIQESLTNISRHARTNEAWLRAIVEGENLVLEIEDHGAGMRRVDGAYGGRHGSSAGPRTGLGIVAMRERTQIVRGSFDLRVPEAGGTCIHVRVPLKAPDSGEAVKILENEELP